MDLSDKGCDDHRGKPRYRRKAGGTGAFAAGPARGSRCWPAPRKRIADIAGEIGETAIAIPCDVARFHEGRPGRGRGCCRPGAGWMWLVNNAGVIDPIGGPGRRGPRRLEPLRPTSTSRASFTACGRRMPVMIREAGGGTIIKRLVRRGAIIPVGGWSGLFARARRGPSMLTPDGRQGGPRQGPAGAGTVARHGWGAHPDMQRDIKASGINPVSRLDWSDHVPAGTTGRPGPWSGLCGPEAGRFPRARTCPCGTRASAPRLGLA